MLNICFICDDNYVVLTKTAINSLVQTQTEKLKIYVIGVEISDENAKQFESFSSKKVEIEVIRKDNLYRKIKHNHPYLTQAAFMKFVIPDILSEDKVLYIDGDTITTGDISEFYKTDISDYYAAVVRDLVAEYDGQDHQRLKQKFYFNAGVMLLNLRKMRKDNIAAKLSDYAIHDKELKYLDQDAFNVVFGDKVIYADFKWNYLNVYETKNYEELKYVTEKKIIHYAGCKPWNSAQCPLSDEWLKYVLPEDFGAVLKAYLKQYDNKVQTQQQILEDMQCRLAEFTSLKNAWKMWKNDRILCGVCMSLFGTAIKRHSMFSECRFLRSKSKKFIFSAYRYGRCANNALTRLPVCNTLTYIYTNGK